MKEALLFVFFFLAAEPLVGGRRMEAGGCVQGAVDREEEG